MGASPTGVTDGAGAKLAYDWSSETRVLTVTLPAGLKAAKAQPVNLRGEKTGQVISITDRKLTFSLPAYAPASFILRMQ